MATRKQPKAPLLVDDLNHDSATRINIPSAEHEPIVPPEQARPVTLRYPRNAELDPQLVWKGKDAQDDRELEVKAPPLFIQERVHPKALIQALVEETKAGQAPPDQVDLFADFNGLPTGAEKTDFYQHEGHWTNRMILGDSLQVMGSLAEREGLRGKVQCIYFDPPYGIKFNSNFQWSTTSRDVKDGKADHITREPEQVKAFRDTWRDGIHSYLTYLRDRLTVARDLLTDSGSIFVQIGDENVHRVRAMMDEVFGEANLVSSIAFKKTSGTGSKFLENIYDYALWYAKDISHMKYRQPLAEKGRALLETQYTGSDELREIAQQQDPRFMAGDMSSQGASEAGTYPFPYQGQEFILPPNTHWKASRAGMPRLAMSGRLIGIGQRLRYRRYADDYPVVTFFNSWDDTIVSGYADPKVYVVQTSTKVIQRCLLMATDPGDLVLDPTCGSGTTAYVAEQWGRRWITIDTSRVALALARARIMGARYPYYLLADSPEGQQKEAELTRNPVSKQATGGNLSLGFVYERVPHITLKSIANNAEIDVIWDKWQRTLEPLREALNAALKQTWQEWEIPREAVATWPAATKQLHTEWWQARIARQKEVDASIAAKAEFEYLFDKPYEDKKKVRVAGPFTVESIHPHRMLSFDDSGQVAEPPGEQASDDEQRFVEMALAQLRKSGLQQARKADRLVFDSVHNFAGRYLCAEGSYTEADGTAKRAAIYVGPEFGSVGRQDLVEAAREAADGRFDLLVACAFHFEPHTADLDKLGKVPVLKARMNADLHMADDLKNTGKGNLFVVFGEPDIDVLREGADYRVKVKGIDIFRPTTGQVESSRAEDIACWFVDTNYDGESFFVRQAYFLGQNDPYESLKRTLKAEVNEEAWSSLHSDTSRPFPRPTTGRFAVKVINHLGDEVMKVFRV